MVSRVDRSVMAEWWRTVDRLLLGAVLFLMLCGVLLSFAASPAVADRIGADTFHFIKRHAMFLVPAAALFIGVSFLSPRQVRRASFVLLGIAIMLMIATLFIGAEVKGSRRWITLAGISIQPSELLKPAFVVITAWLFAENARRPEIPGNLFSIILFGIVAALLLAQPDFGQTMLVAIVWGALFFMAGMPWLWIVGLGVTAIGGLAAAYSFFPHVAGRIDRFITGEGDNFQVETAREAIINGGWLGQGPGEGTVKRIIPDSHADFPFAVAAEEFGIIACMLLVALFAFIVLRGLNHALSRKGSIRAARGLRVDHAVRQPVDDQHDGQSSTDAGQGHDAAVHILWRFVAAFDGRRHGFRASRLHEGGRRPERVHLMALRCASTVRRGEGGNA